MIVMIVIIFIIIVIVIVIVMAAENQFPLLPSELFFCHRPPTQPVHLLVVVVIIL
jgi:hypothetical protein